MLTPKPPRRKQPAFTLIELLVVIAIIAILATIAVPAYSGMVSKSQGAGCLSNMRTLGTALLSYAADNNGFLPRGSKNLPPGSTNWEDAVSYNKAVYTYIPNQNNKMDGRQMDKVFRCPAEKQPTQMTNTFYQYSATFALELGNSASKATGIDGNGPRTLASIENPSKTILLVDGKIGINNSSEFNTDSSCNWNAVKADIGNNSPTNAAKISFRHSATGAMNVVYADGHVGTIRWEDRNDTNKLSEPIWRGRGY
jgi:prepilin-type N-terminal cleavage/methylation domain-containing protein/prepilin-type processing-associated H-X9-DG protein